MEKKNLFYHEKHSAALPQPKKRKRFHRRDTEVAEFG
jgi:hypothetical protein